MNKIQSKELENMIVAKVKMAHDKSIPIHIEGAGIETGEDGKIRNMKDSQNKPCPVCAMGALLLGESNLNFNNSPLRDEFSSFSAEVSSLLKIKEENASKLEWGFMGVFGDNSNNYNSSYYRTGKRVYERCLELGLVENKNVLS